MLPYADFSPPALARPGEMFISPWAWQSLGAPMWAQALTLPSSNNYIAANVVCFYPFGLPEPAVVTKLYWVNGAAVAGNYDAGVYDEAGTLLVSTGSVAAASANAFQVTDVTDTTLARGRYYMAIVSDTSGATQTIISLVPAAGILQSLGMLEQAGVTLPLATNASPATFAKYTRAFIPYTGALLYRAVGP